MEPQKTPNSQSNVEKENQSRRHQNPRLQHLLHQDSMVLAQKHTHRHWNRTENLELDPEMYSQLIFDKTGKGIHWKKKTVSLANGGARTGQQHAEE